MSFHLENHYSILRRTEYKEFRISISESSRSMKIEVKINTHCRRIDSLSKRNSIGKSREMTISPMAHVTLEYKTRKRKKHRTISMMYS